MVLRSSENGRSSAMVRQKSARIGRYEIEMLGDVLAERDLQGILRGSSALIEALHIHIYIYMYRYVYYTCIYIYV